MKYAKLNNGVLEYPSINKDNIINYNMNEELMLQDGFKPIQEAEKPEGNFKAVYTEDENCIIEEWVDNSAEVEAAEKMRIGKLKMTKYDFHKYFCQPNDITYAELMEFINTKEELQAAWNLCNHVYRGDETLNTYIKKCIPNITDDEITEIFEAHKS